MDDAALAKPARSASRGSAGYHPAVASSRVPGLLALEIRGRPGRPTVSRELRDLIRRMSTENPLCGAPRIHGELLKLGFEVAESTVSKYMVKHRGPPSAELADLPAQSCGCHCGDRSLCGSDADVECLFAFVVVSHGRRQLLWFAVTRHPTAEWLAQQIVEAFPWDTAPRYLVRDNDCAYGPVFTSRIRAMGIRDHPISLRSPWQNPYVERLIGNTPARLLGSMS